MAKSFSHQLSQRRELNRRCPWHGINQYRYLLEEKALDPSTEFLGSITVTWSLCFVVTVVK
jgi:hypothetical protein